MTTTEITQEKLENFKRDLLREVRKMVSESQSPPTRKWLKTQEILKMLSISQGTLQHLRIKGILPFTKIGGVILYDRDEIEKVLRDNKSNRDFPSRKNNPWRKI
ncbi:helix-turn-helix domain-containing protein [Chryseolinea soli]|uniref:DNA-binding protein n=1 Tax=Chryseolinea soli TaxID=2321403 RepID=A0A385SME9_9BACT|nr:helix-turn-helix domain-containing protein [Chryseolinea soli]AYB32012.1 DNA-binding protein [Chryseolinea soli]